MPHVTYLLLPGISTEVRTGQSQQNLHGNPVMTCSFCYRAMRTPDAGTLGRHGALRNESYGTFDSNSCTFQTSSRLALLPGRHPVLFCWRGLAATSSGTRPRCRPARKTITGLPQAASFQEET
jgi:hypothetical protein